MKQAFKQVLELDKPIMPEDVPRLFKALYGPLMAGLERKSMVPDLESLRMWVKHAKNGRKEAFIILVDGVTKERNLFEEANNEWTSGREGGGKEN